MLVVCVIVVIPVNTYLVERKDKRKKLNMSQDPICWCGNCGHCCSCCCQTYYLCHWWISENWGNKEHISPCLVDIDILCNIIISSLSKIKIIIVYLYKFWVYSMISLSKSACQLPLLDRAWYWSPQPHLSSMQLNQEWYYAMQTSWFAVLQIYLTQDKNTDCLQFSLLLRRVTHTQHGGGWDRKDIQCNGARVGYIRQWF